MSRGLPWLNLFGVLALAILCAVQWKVNQTLNLEVNSLEKARQALEQKLSEQEQAAQGQSADLAHFKEQFSRTHEEVTDAKDKLRALERERTQLSSERDQLKESVEKWSAAVTSRDARIEEANARLRELGARLNESIQKFNALATNYNRVVADLNTTRSNIAAASTNQPNR